MEDIDIRKLEEGEAVPYNLLLLADPDIGAINQYINSATIYVATLCNQMVGVYVLYPLHDGTVEIKNIAVEEIHQRRGIGKLLLKDAESVSKNKNYQTIIIGTGNSSIGQLGLYQRQGFEIFDIKKNFFTDNYAAPIFEDGIQCKHMIMLAKKL
jgi:aminoglycoside 6'-N-acetyltransferase I